MQDLQANLRWTILKLSLPLSLFFSPLMLPAQQHDVASATNTSSVSAPSTPAARALGDHYLMLVNTAIAFRLKDEELAQFDKSPYDGIAVQFSYNYDSSPPPAASDMAAKIAHWKNITGKDIWPWVNVNRMIGVEDNDLNPYNKDNKYFRGIKGADLEDQNGALTDFLKIFENALRAAKDSGVPGVVCDPEFYNFHKAYNLQALSAQYGKSPDELIPLLRNVGTRMADVAGSTYPNAALWFLFTGFGFKGHWTFNGRTYNGAPTYIVEGLLDEIQKKHFPLKVISGGEASLAYCHDSLEAFQNKIDARARVFAPELSKYQGILELGGTIALFTDRNSMTGWVKADCSNSKAATAEDLQPYLELLLKTFRYNWIYGSGDGGYHAFRADVAPRFDAVIRKAEAKAYGASSH